MNKIDKLTKEQLAHLLVIAYSDLTFAVGYIDGLGKPNSYLTEEWGVLSDYFMDDEAPQKGTTTDATTT